MALSVVLRPDATKPAKMAGAYIEYPVQLIKPPAPLVVDDCSIAALGKQELFLVSLPGLSGQSSGRSKVRQATGSSGQAG